MKISLYLLFFHLSQAEIIYSPNNIDSSFSPQSHTLIENWLGVSEDTSVGRPYLTRISTNDTFIDEGYVTNGEISVVLYQGSVHIVNDIGDGILEKKGEKYWTAPNEFIRFNMTANTIIYIFGAEYDLADMKPYEVCPECKNRTAELTRFYLMENRDAKDIHDIHINNGTSNATDDAWNSTLTTPPWLTVKSNQNNSWVWLHDHPYGVIYFIIEGCLMYFCYETDCFLATDGDVRYEQLGVIYREKIIVKPGYDYCYFAVSDFYYNHPEGQPNFYNKYFNISTQLTYPLRSIAHL